MKQLKPLLLASASPRRSELLNQVGLEFTVRVTDIDETAREAELPEDYVKRLAGEKALAGVELAGGGMPVLGADTVVLLDDRILGKPASRTEAADMIRSMSNRDHLVLSAVALAQSASQVDIVLNTTRVSFSEVPEEFIDWYCSSDEPLDKAGAYAIQGRIGQFVSRLDGSYSSVMGLPLYETCRLLRNAGILS